MDYLTIKEAGEKWGVGSRIVTVYCNTGRIEKAVKKGNLWLVPRTLRNLPTKDVKKINLSGIRSLFEV